MTLQAPWPGAPVTGGWLGANDVGYIRQFAEAGSHYLSVDSSMRKE